MKMQLIRKIILKLFLISLIFQLEIINFNIRNKYSITNSRTNSRKSETRMLKTFESSNLLLGVDDGPDGKKEAKDVPDFITDFLKNPNNKTVNPTRLIMWYRLLAYENRLYRLFMILGLIPVDIDFDSIKNHKILEVLKPLLLETFDENTIIDLKQCFDRGLNSFFICLIRFGKFQINDKNISFVPGKFNDPIIKENLDPKYNDTKPTDIIPIQNNPVPKPNPTGVIVPKEGIILNANILQDKNKSTVNPTNPGGIIVPQGGITLNANILSNKNNPAADPTNPSNPGIKSNPAGIIVPKAGIILNANILSNQNKPASDPTDIPKVESITKIPNDNPLPNSVESPVPFKG